jgi:hypothetical protein
VIGDVAGTPVVSMKSVFKKDPKLAKILMGLDGYDPVYPTPEPERTMSNIITDNADSNFEAGRMLDNDASNMHGTIKPVSDIRDNSEEPENKKQRFPVEKAINKDARLE